MNFFLVVFIHFDFINAILCKSVYENIMNKHFIPHDFAYLFDINASILQDIRNAKNYNILGKPLDFYESAECILTKIAAQKLSKVQIEVQSFANFSKNFLTLRVFECYRPKISNEQMFYSIIQKKVHFRKNNFFPNLNEADLIKMGFIEISSPYSRGSTVAVTLSNNNLLPIFKESEDIRSVDCGGDYLKRYMFDLGLDMGSNYDCLDEVSFENSTLPYSQISNRKLLKILMENHGFVQSSKLNWWEFTLKNEPFNETSFNFPIKQRIKKNREKSGYCTFKANASKISWSL